MKVRELLSDKSKWTKGKFARDSSGSCSPILDSTATAFCLAGAAFHCYSHPLSSITFNEIWSILWSRLKTTPTTWNDSPERTFEEVKALVEELDI